MERAASIPTPQTQVSFDYTEGYFVDCTVDCTEDCSVDCTKDYSVDCTVDCSLLRNIFSFLFFISAVFHKFMTLGNASRMFLSRYWFFLFFCHFLFNTKSTRIFVLYIDIYILNFLKSLQERLIHHLSTHCFHRVLFLGPPVPLDTIQLWPWPIFLGSFVLQNKAASATINSAHDVYLRWLILTRTASSCQVLHQL